MGASRLEGRSYGEPNSVKQGLHGIITTFTAVVILQSQTTDYFRAFVNADAGAGFVYNTRSHYKQLFRAADDPVTFGQDQQPVGPPLGFDT